MVLERSMPLNRISKTFFWTQGDGVWPDRDVDGRPFSEENSSPEWRAKAGTTLCGPYRAALDGLQGDQDYLAKLLNLQRALAYSSCESTQPRFLPPHPSLLFVRGTAAVKQCRAPWLGTKAVSKLQPGVPQSMLYTAIASEDDVAEHRKTLLGNLNGMEVSFEADLWSRRVDGDPWAFTLV